MILQALRAVRQSRNKDSHAIAMMHRSMINAFGAFGKDHQPLEDIAPFMPCPREWLLAEGMNNGKLGISQRCANAVLKEMDALPSAAYTSLQEMVPEIQAIAVGG
ncbi:MAG: hypothetical protein ACRC4J_00105 [Cetobacterium sp.]